MAQYTGIDIRNKHEHDNSAMIFSVQIDMMYQIDIDMLATINRVIFEI